MEVIFFNEKLERWVASFERPTAAKVVRIISLLEERGQEIGLPCSKSLGRGLFELRIYGDQPVRIFYTFHQNHAVLLHGYVKKTFRINQRELDKARQLLMSLY